MQITTVHYQKVNNLGNHENSRTGAYAHVEESETPEEALEKLMAWVESQGTQVAEARSELETLHNDISHAKWRKERIATECEQMKAAWEAQKAWLAKIGLKLPSHLRNDIPF